MHTEGDGEAVDIDDGTPAPPSKFRKKLDESSASEDRQGRR